MLNLARAMTPADLQKAIWLLTALEAEGVSDLPEARRRLDEALRKEHRLRQGRTLRQVRPPEPQDHGPCPKCGAPLYAVTTDDAEIKIVGCWKCRFSSIVEVTQ